MSSLSERLREIADDIEDTELDDERNLTVSFRVDVDEDQKMHERCQALDVGISQCDDRYQGSFQAFVIR